MAIPTPNPFVITLSMADIQKWSFLRLLMYMLLFGSAYIPIIVVQES